VQAPGRNLGLGRHSSLAGRPAAGIKGPAVKANPNPNRPAPWPALPPQLSPPLLQQPLPLLQLLQMPLATDLCLVSLFSLVTWWFQVEALTPAGRVDPAHPR
jgi:hypothetical protein